MLLAAVDGFLEYVKLILMCVLEASSPGRPGDSNGRCGRPSESTIDIDGGNCGIAADIATTATADNPFSTLGIQTTPTAATGENGQHVW